MRLIAFFLGLILSTAPAVAADFRILPQSPLATGCPFDHLGGTAMNMQVAIGTSRAGCPYRSIGPGMTINGYGNPVTPEERSQDAEEVLFRDGTPGIFGGGTWSAEMVTQMLLAEAMISVPMIRMSGEIAPGDAERLDQLLRGRIADNCLPDGRCPFSAVLALESPGGSLEAALELAVLVHRRQLITYIPAGATCASSCAFVFFAGHADFGAGFHPRRIVHSDSRLGLHRPSVALTAEVYAGRQVQQIIDLIDSVKAEAVRQFAAARVPMHFLEWMYATAPDDMTYLTAADLSLFATIIGNPWPDGARPTRAGLLAFCAAEHRRATGNTNLDLLFRLDLRENSFVIHGRDGFFACYGARSTSGWVVDICTPRSQGEEPDHWSTCQLIRCMNDESSDICNNQNERWDFTDQLIIFGSLTRALSAINASRLHEIVRQLSESSAILLPLPSWTATVAAPSDYCGIVDLHAPDTARAVQVALAARGFDVGPPDGLIGARTLAALDQAVSTLAPGRRTDDSAVLRALGFTEAQIHQATLCD